MIRAMRQAVKNRLYLGQLESEIEAKRDRRQISIVVLMRDVTALVKSHKNSSSKRFDVLL